MPTRNTELSELARPFDLGARARPKLAKLRETERTDGSDDHSLAARSSTALDVMRPRCSHDDPGLWRDREARQRQPSDDTPVSYLLCLVNFPDCD